MKTIILAFIFSLRCYMVKAQTPAPVTDSTPANCIWKLKNIIYPDIAISAPIRYGKLTASPSFKDPEYANDLTCNSADNCYVNDTTDLHYIVYYPINHRYDSLALPVVVLFHPGKFSDCNGYEVDFIDSICRHFAKRGVIAVNAEYRRGRLVDPNADKSVQQQMISYMGLQDGIGVLRTLIKKARTPGPNPLFKMDTTKIFLGGASAGGTISLGIAYYRTQAMADSAFPTPPGQPTTKQALGPINADYYLADTNVIFRPYIKGVLNMWSGPNIPFYTDSIGQETNFFSQGAVNSYDNPPMIAFHGMKDNVFPYFEDNKQNLNFSVPPKSGFFNYNSTSSCLLDGAPTPYGLDTFPAKKDLVQGSSLNMYNVLTDLDKLTELYVDSTMKHGTQDGDDFGTLLATEEEVWLYIVQRAAVFFQAVLNNKSPADLGNNFFLDCENKRVRCDKPNTTCP